jgi:hypothetical protein
LFVGPAPGTVGRVEAVIGTGGLWALSAFAPAAAIAGVAPAMVRAWCSPWCPVGASIDHQPGPAQRGDPELGIGLGPERVVDLGDDPLDAERLDGQLG